MHLVLFKWKSTLSISEVNELCDQLLSLKDSCVHPETNQPYIVKLTGGKDNSPEAMQLQKGFTHGFVFEFASVADRDYYVYKDQAHAKVGGVVTQHSEDIAVVDYEVGVF